MIKKSLDSYFDMSPSTHGQTFFTIRCYCDFEPHGRASETWEPVYELELLGIPYHYHSTNGWKVGTSTTGYSMKFKGRVLTHVINRAKFFMEWYNENRD